MGLRERYVEAYLAAWNQGLVDALDPVMSAAFSRHSRQGSIDLAGFKSVILEARDAFPDLTTELDEVLETNRGLVVRWTSLGTHEGPYLGVAATGRRVEVSGVTIVHFGRSGVEEEHVTWNPTDLLRSAGSSPLSEGPVAEEGRQELDDAMLRQVHGTFVTGVTVVTTMDDGLPKGLAVSAFSSLSLSPPMILVCVARTSQSHPSLMRAEAFGVSILGAHQADVAQAFARSGGDKFAGLRWHCGDMGVPIIDDCSGFFEARVRERIESKTHTVFVGDVVRAGASGRLPLVYLGGTLYDPAGLEPVQAPRPESG